MTDKNDCAFGKVTREKVSTLEREMGETRKDIKAIKDDLLKRPSWTITIIIAFLSSTTVGLLVSLVRLLGYKTG